jgi:alpha-tubulin suppressor-like RCC1 family protein
MKNNKHSLFQKILVSIIISFILISSCTHPTKPNDKIEKTSYGQIAVDFVNAILKPDGTIWTWGPNVQGTLGNGTTIDSETPVKVLNINNAVALDLFAGIAIAADKEGNIWFWGNYLTYLEPPGYDTIVTQPAKISYLTGIKSLNIFALNLFLLRDDGTVWYINLDHKSPTKYLEPKKIEGIQGIVELSDMVALSKDGKLYTLKPQKNQITFDSISHVIHFSNVYQRRCVCIKYDSTVWAWGTNDYGQLGDGTNVDKEVPVQVLNLSSTVCISSNYDYNLALNEDGTVWFWGLEVPNGQNSIGLNTPVKIQNLDDVVLIYASKQSLVMKRDGTYWSIDSETKIPIKVL